jgi:hypothetical protein
MNTINDDRKAFNGNYGPLIIGVVYATGVLIAFVGNALFGAS